MTGAAASAPARRGVVAVGVVLLALGAGGGLAAATDQALEIRVDGMQGPGWSTGAVRVAVSPGDAPGRWRLDATVDALSLPAPFDRPRPLSLQCEHGVSDGPRIECPTASVSLGDAAAAARLTGRVVVDTERGSVRLDAPAQEFAGGRVQMSVEAARERFSLQAELTGLDAASVARLLAPGVAQGAAVDVTAGTVSATVALHVDGDGGSLGGELHAAALDFSDASGLHAGEGVGVDARVDARRSAAGWNGEARAALAAGAVYAHPVLVEAGAEPLTVRASGRLTAAGVLDLAALQLHDPGVVDVRASVRAALAPAPRLERVSVELGETAVAPIYERYLRPFAGAGALSDLRLGGRVAARAQWREDGPAAMELALRGVDAGDAAGRFTLLGLDGDLYWTRGGAARPSRLRWSAAELYRVDFGEGALDAVLADRELRLVAPVRVRVLDGSIALARVHGTGLGTTAQRVEIEAELAAVSLERLCERLAWLPLAGRIGGRVPSLVYENGRLAVDGVVTVDLFDGRMSVSGLELAQPFGVAPRLRADVVLEDLSLELLTRALSFGRIEGRLQGRVDGLTLVGWRPVAFDARVGTPPHDTSTHRISQRAVDNLASLGGANAVLSSTFLRIFSEFSYSRLGLACRLRAGVCEMDGVAPAARGYYIVEGGGLPPRVDVVGFNRRVDWNTLVSRLRAVVDAGPPTVR